MTLFPETVNAFLHESILGRASKKGILEINCVQIRDYTENKQRQVDDYPYGGGWGCVLMAQPLKSCLDSIMSTASGLRSRVIYLSPQGTPFTQETAKRLKRDYEHLVLVCGHYEGVDERFIEQCVDEEISLGDFVLTGGEIAAMAVADAVCRLVPGVLADEQCYTGESHWDGLLEYPQYTRPEVWEGREVPPVLLEGNHDRIGLWRRQKQLERTRERRPDMYAAFVPADKQDQELLRRVERAQDRVRLTEPVRWRPAEESDLTRILEIAAYARKTLRAHGVDQWQGEYPTEAAFRADIRRGECFVVTHGEETAAFFVLSRLPEESYEEIRDGKWSGVEPCGVLHRAAVAAEYRGGELSHRMLRCAEEQARAWGLRCLRTDTHKKNKAMRALLQDAGFRYRGNLTISTEPGHDPARQAYEKNLKDRA